MKISQLDIKKTQQLFALLCGAKRDYTNFNLKDGVLVWTGVIIMDDTSYDSYHHYTTMNRLIFNKSLDWMFRLIIKLSNEKISLDKITIQLMNLTNSSFVLTSVNGLKSRSLDYYDEYPMTTESIANELFNGVQKSLDEHQEKIEQIIGMTIDRMNEDIVVVENGIPRIGNKSKDYFADVPEDSPFFKPLKSNNTNDF